MCENVILTRVFSRKMFPLQSLLRCCLLCGQICILSVVMLGTNMAHCTVVDDVAHNVHDVASEQILYRFSKSMSNLMWLLYASCLCLILSVRARFICLW